MDGFLIAIIVLITTVGSCLMFFIVLMVAVLIWCWWDYRRCYKDVDVEAAREPDPELEERRIKEVAGRCTECVFCLEEYADDDPGESRRTLKPCGHRFHKDCIDVWLNKGRLCPICAGVPRDSSVSVQGNRSPVPIRE